MSGPPNWNPRLQTSSVRFPRKAVETPQIPPNTTARPRPGTPFQAVYPNPITQIPAITAEVTGCGKILDSLYLLNNGTGEAVPYNVTRQTMRGVPTPTVITIATSERYIVFGIDFPYRMSGTDHFVFTFTNQNTNEVTIKNYQPAAQYLVSGLEPGILYTLTVSPYVNGITYPASPPTNPFAISAISEKNVELQGVTLSGGDRSAYISFTGAIPGPPIALAVSNIAIDDNFINYQLRCNLGPSPPRPVNTGTVFVGNLTNGSSYTFTVTPYGETDGIFEYGRPTTLPPYIPGPPSDLFINSITANTTTAFLNTTYDTLVHPIPVSNIVSIWESTFTTICSLVSRPVTAVQDLSQSYAGFTTLSSLFTTADITYLKSTISAKPGIIQVDITDNTGLWYSFPLANVSGGGIGYVFENSNFTKTQSLYATASSSYTLLFREVKLEREICSQIYSPPQTAFTYNGILSKMNHTFIGQNFANGLQSLRTAYATVAVGEPLFPTNITGISGSHIVSISFTGYDPTLAIPGPKPTFFRYSDNYGNTYTTINSNIVINGLTDTSLYTFTIAGFGNGVYGYTAQYSITPGVRPPSSLSVLAVSNYDVTLSFSPALGGADFYAVVTQNGLAQSASAFPYKIQGLSADVSYYFGAVSFAYTSPVYSILSSVSANLIQEVSSSYAQFLISPSGFPYASGVQQGRTEFVPYLYTITASGQSPAPPTVNVINRDLANIFPVGTALYATTNISTLALVQSGVSAGIAYTVTTSGVSYTLTSIGVSGRYYVLNGGPSTLISLSGQVLSLSVIPISNTFTFPIASVTSIYDANGNITAYNVQNPSILKSTTTFSGATVYRTTISAVIPFFSGMAPTTFLGTVSSSTFTPAAQNPTFVGPPSNVIITSSAYASQEVRFELTVSGRVNPSLYSYAEVSGKILPGTSRSPSIAIRGLTNGSSYTFSISAFGNQVYSPSATRSARFDLCTNAPQNVFASFFNVTPNISYARSTPSADTYVAELYDTNRLIQTISQVTAGSFQFPDPVLADTTYNFRVYGILKGISSTVCNIPGVIAGPPFTPTPPSTVLTSGQIVFNWSSGNPNYSERFRITEYLSNNGVFPTGGQWSNISGLTYTVSAVVTASGTQAFAPTNWIEVSPGYASFVLSNDGYEFLRNINTKYLSNQIYLTLQQSGGVSYTFPLTNISDYNSLSNIYTNPNYPKETTDIFNPALSLSVTYSYGTGPFNYGKYFYTLDSFANQVYGPSAGIAAQMFVEPVNGVPTVSVTGTTGTTATVSFAQTAITGSVYRVTNNYGSNVSAAPYAFTNLSTGRPYTFSVVVSNGAFVSISSASSIPIYVGPPSAPLLSTSYYGTTSTVYVTDTTLSLASVFFDSGKQGTGTNIATPSHTNVIQQTSGGFWVGNATGLNGNIKDTLTGFISASISAGTTAYSNDGIANAMYQFTVTPSTGTMAVSLSSYRLFISGTSLVVSNGSTQVYSATVTASSYPIQFVSRSIAFGIQSGLSSFFYTSVPASSDLLTISLGGAASFSDYRVYSLNNVGVPASSYTIRDQNSTVYDPSLAYTVYSLSGITYANNLFNVTQNQTFTLSVRPLGNGVQGPAGTASLYINTPPPQVPYIASLVDTSATVTVGKAPTLPIDSYSLIQYQNGIAINTQTQPAAYSPYAVPGLNLWMDGADTTTYTYQAGSITNINSWTDKSTNGYVFTQAPVTAGAITTSIQNGKTAINMGANVMTIPNFTWYTQFTTFFVLKSDNWFYNGGGVTLPNTNFYRGYVFSGNSNLILTPGAGVAYDPNYGIPNVTPVSSVIPNQWCIFSIGYGGGTQAANYAVNGTPRSTNAGLTPTGQSATSTPLYLNGRWDYAAGNTQVGEIIHYNRSITTQERQTIESYLANKWGLELGLPPNTVSGLTLWMDAADPNATGVPAANGALITTWKDKSGLGSDGTAEGVALQYTTPTNTICNVPGGATGSIVIVTVIGGGGGGSTYSDFTGGNGAVATYTFSGVTLRSTISYFVGNGGAASSSSSGGNGGRSSYVTIGDTTIYAGGGGGAVVRSPASTLYRQTTLGSTNSPGTTAGDFNPSSYGTWSSVSPAITCRTINSGTIPILRVLSSLFADATATFTGPGNITATITGVLTFAPTQGGTTYAQIAFVTTAGSYTIQYSGAFGNAGSTIAIRGPTGSTLYTSNPTTTGMGGRYYIQVSRTTTSLVFYGSYNTPTPLTTLYTVTGITPQDQFIIGISAPGNYNEGVLGIESLTISTIPGSGQTGQGDGGGVNGGNGTISTNATAGTRIGTYGNGGAVGDTAGSSGIIRITMPPAIISTGLNSRPTMNFGGSSWFTGLTTNTSSTMTTFIVLQHPVVTTASYIRFLSMAPATAQDQDVGGLVAEITGGQTIVVANGNAGADFPQPNNTPYIMDFQANGTNLTAYLNGTAYVGNASTTNFNITRYRVGSMVGNDTNVYTGYISEVLIYNTALTTVQRQNIESYLANKWGLTVAAASPQRIPPAPATPTSYTFRYPDLINHSNYYFRAYATLLGVSSSLTDPSFPTVEAGRPYTLSGLTASLLNPSATIGTYTLSAILKVGANSNGDMTVFVSGNSRVVSRTVRITTSADQEYSFTVSGGAVYTLSSLAVLNSVQVVGPTTTIPAFPFRPQGASLTISTANLGSTYRGIINVTNPSPTIGVTYYYAHSSNNGATVTDLSTTNTFTATYGLSYVGYVYSCNAALGLLSTASAVTTTCNLYWPPPSNAIATYNGTNITVNWSANAVSSRYTVRETSGKLDTSTNINTETIRFTGTTGSSYIFEVAAQSVFSPDPSLIYSAFTPTTTISLTTLSAAPVTIDYNGNTITLSWANRGLGYVYTVSQMIGPSLGNINQPNPGQNTITIETVSTFKTYQFAISTSLNGISGGISFSPSITLSTAALNNVSQSYNGNSTGSVSYTISWNSYTPTTDSTIPNYIVREISGKTFEVSGFSRTSFTTANTSAAFTLARTVSSYTFQVNAIYKGISGPVTTLSAIYMDVNAPPSPPTTTYFNSNITVSWSAAAQPDGNSRPDSYTVYDTIGGTLSSNVTGTNNSVNLTARVGLSYQFTVTSFYKGITSPTGLCGDIIRVFTPPPADVVVTNSGANLVVSWTGSTNSPNATYSVRQTAGPTVIPSGFNNVGIATSYTSPSAVTTLSDKIFYNFTVVALSNGLSSDSVSADVAAFVYTYPVTNVFIYYSNTQLFAGWTPDYRQPNATFNVTAYLQSTSSSVGGVNTESGISSIRIVPGTSNSSYYAKVYATNNNLRQSIPSSETTSTNVVTLFTAPPIFNGIGFNGNYAITVNLSSGPQATDDRLRNADTYTLTEVNNLFFPNASSWTFRPTEVYTIPTLGTQGLTYNFSLYATLCGLASVVASPSGTKQLRLITNPVPANSVVADYFGTTITISWGKAAQDNVGDANSDPNGGYTIYVSSQANAVTTLYPNRSIQFIGFAGSNYQFSIAAVNNNVGSSLVTGPSALVTLYRPVVQFLNVTNSGNVTASGVYYAKMILTWLPDSTNAPDATYTGTAFNRGTGRLEATDSTSSNTLMFNGSLNATYDLTVTARYKGINGNPSTVQISNARPILTVEPLINIGNIVTVNYSANEAFSSFDASIRPNNGGQVISNIVTTSAFASWRVTTSTGGFGYSVSTTAFFNGIPSTTIARTITLTEPAAPSSITFRYNNALVSVSWSPVTTNASSYTFTAYDLSADPPILTSSQPGLLATSTSFLGISGHTYNVSAFALSSNNITSLGTGTTATIEIPPAPNGPLILSNTGTLVSVSWTISAGYGYAFYVSNVAQRGTIIYSNQFALPGDTFTGVIGQTYSVSLFQISPSNVTSVGSIANTWKVYQPSIPFVSFTNIGRDNTVTWPQDVEGSNCVFRLTDNYLYSNILFPDPANYTGASNGWAVGDVSGWFSPKDLPGCTLWLDASDPSNTGSPVANGTAITPWKDKSGLGCNATATGTLTISSTGLNGRPTMNFNGGSWFAGATANRGTTMTVFTVLQHPVVTAASFTRFLSMAPATTLDQNAGGILAELTSGTNLVVANGNAQSGFPQPNNTPYIMDFQANGTNLIAYLNGTEKETSASTTNFNITRYRIGSMIDIDTNVYTGKISEVLIYSNALTPVQRAQVENYLSQKWGIAVTSTALTHAPPLNACNITANYTQVGSYISYTVTTPADETGATNAGRPYIYSVVPSWNGTNGNTVSTDTESPIRLYKPTTPGGFGATGQGNSFTLTWQSAVIWTSPASTIIPTYLLQVGPTTVSPSYPTQSFNVVGNTQTVNGFDSSAGSLTISLAGVTPLGYTNPIYGNPAVLTYTVPSGTNVSITQSPTNAETLIVTVPVRSVDAQRTWFFITGTGQGGASTVVVSNFQNYNRDSSNYNVTVSLGYNYTISAALTSSTTSPPTPADPSAPANPNPFPAKTLNVSGITVTHDACTVTLAWSAVAGAERYYVRTNNNGQPASGKFGQEYPSTTRTVQISNNGGSPTEQFASNAIYSYIVQAYTLSSNRFQGSSVGSCNILSDIAVSSNVQMYIPTNPTVQQLSLTQSFSNIIASWPVLDSYPKDNSADIGTPSYTISCQTFPSVTTTGTTATFGPITPGTSYPISLNTNYKGFWGATPTTTTFATTSATFTSGPTLTNTGERQIRVTASAARVGFWYLISGNTETLMNSPTTVASNQITSNFPAEKATTYTRSIKFVTQDTGLSVTSGLLSVATPSLAVSAPTTADVGADRKFSITLTHTGTAGAGGIAWDVTPPIGTTFLTGSTTTNPTTLTYQFTNAAWSTNLLATFTSIDLANNGFTFPYTGPNPTFTPPNLNIPTPTLANSAGNLVLSASTTGGCNVNWFWPTYGGVTGTATTPATTLTVNYGALGNTGTTYSAGAALSLSFGGYTNSVAQNSLPTFTAPTFSIGTVTFADPNVGTKIIRLTANYGTYSAGTTGGDTRPQWTFPSTTSNGGPYTQLSASAPFTSPNSPATLDYSTTSLRSSYAIAARTISLSYLGISISYGFLLTASTPNISLALSGTYSGTTITVNATNASGVVGNWSLGTITPSVGTPTQSPANPTAAPTFTIPGAAAGNTYTIPVNFSYNNDQFTSASSASVFIPTPIGTALITGATFLYSNANSIVPNGFNVTYTPSGFTPGASTPASIGCTTPVTTDQVYNNFSPRIEVSNATNNANVQKGDRELNANVIYQANATESRSGVLGPLSTRNVVMPGAVSNIKWGSTSAAVDSALATLSSIWISWTPISVDSSIASRFTYTLYSNTTIPTRPSTTAPTEAVSGYTGLAVGTSNIQFRIPNTGSQTYFIGTTYTDPSGYSYYSAASPQIKFTYGLCNVTVGTGPGSTPTTFIQLNSKTYLVANLGAGNGGRGGDQDVGANGGLGASWSYDGSAVDIIKSGYTILFVPGYNGLDGSVGGGGGAGFSNGLNGTIRSAYSSFNTYGGGGGGSARFWVRDPATNNATIVSISPGGGGGGGGSIDGNGGKGAGAGGGAGGAGASSSQSPTVGSPGNVFGTIANFGTSVNSRPGPATSTCVIYYVVPG